MRCSQLALAFAASLASSAAAADLDLILYGADGCVGHFAASHLAQQPDLKWAIAGRTEAHLQALATQLAKEGGNSSKPEIIVAALDGKSDPKAWVTRAKAVITAAGPFSAHGGELVVKACAENGVHYSDTSDEFYWQRWMIDRHDAAARETGARVVLSSGFCVLAGDLGSQLALQGLPGSENVSLDAWLETYNGGISEGVLNTGKAIKNATYPKEWDKDPYVLAPSADASLRLDEQVQGMSFPSYVRDEGLIVPNIFGPYDARLLRRAFTHHEQKVFLRVGARPDLYTKWLAFLARHPRSWSSLTKCPTQEIYQGGSWAYRFKAIAGKQSRSVLLSGSGDPGYHFTALGLAETGLCLAGRTPGCSKANVSGGVYTATAAVDVDVMRVRMESIGLLKVDFSNEPDSVSV